MKQVLASRTCDNVDSVLVKQEVIEALQKGNLGQD